MRRSLEGSGRLPAEHLRHADGADAVGAREPAGRRSIRPPRKRTPRRAPSSSRSGCICSATSSICTGSVTVPSAKDPATGAWRGGDLDGAGDGRGLGIAGNCIFVGHANGAGVRRAINIFKIQPEPGEAAAGAGRRDSGDGRRQRGLRRSRAALARLQDLARARTAIILVRNAGTNTLGRMETYPDRHEHVPADDRRAR